MLANHASLGAKRGIPFFSFLVVFTLLLIVPNVRAQNTEKEETATASQLITQFVEALQANKFDEASKLSQRFFRAYPEHRDTPTMLLRSGVLQFRQGEFQRALLYFRRLIAEFPQDRMSPQTRDLLKRMTENQGDQPESIRDRHTPVLNVPVDKNLKPDHSLLITGIILASEANDVRKLDPKLATKLTNEAIKYLDLLIKKHPNSRFINRAQQATIHALATDARLDEALKKQRAINLAEKLKEDEAAFELLKVRLYQLKNITPDKRSVALTELTKACDTFIKTYTESDLNPTVENLRGQAYTAVERYSLAARTYERAAKKYKDNSIAPNLWIQAGLSYRKHAQSIEKHVPENQPMPEPVTFAYQNAVRSFAQVVEHHPAHRLNGRARLMVAANQDSAGDLNAAVKTLEKLTVKDNNMQYSDSVMAQGMFFLAVYYLRQADQVNNKTEDARLRQQAVHLHTRMKQEHPNSQWLRRMNAIFSQ